MLHKMLLSVLALCLMAAGAPGQDATTPTLPWRSAGTDAETSTAPISLDEGKYAVFHTSSGDFIAQLFTKEAPVATESFIGLATGKKKWTHPITRVESSQPLYNNTTIYEIVKDIAIRGGDPIEKGMGDPGFSHEVETNPSIAFDRPGMLAMQKSGNRANGSRWFITLTPFPDWTGQYTIFGKVIGGLDVVRNISRKPTKRPYIPLEAVLLSSIEIVEMGAGQHTTATFSVEDGIKVLTVDKNIITKPAELPSTEAQEGETSPTDASTTAGAAATTATADAETTASK